jgi:two-component system invasion response regulator UvrY
LQVAEGRSTRDGTSAQRRHAPERPARGRSRDRPHGFRLLLETTGQCRVVGEAASGEEAFALYFKLNPDVLVIDIAMPGMGGLEAMNRILARHPDARILVLSAHEGTSCRAARSTPARSAIFPSGARRPSCCRR